MFFFGSHSLFDLHKSADNNLEDDFWPENQMDRKNWQVTTEASEPQN